MRPKNLALRVARTALDKGARSIQILDLRGKADYADMLVLCSGNSTRQVSGIADAVEKDLLRSKVRAASVEGMSSSQWVLLDYIDVVVHVFLDDVRAYYDLEGLWMDAPRVPVPETSPRSASRPKPG
ncbi:MAG: ribosome silencing factor [Deltaproteobacteria bacterium]|nr:ribosome silencing factor [Deltaproteobacteria bacterium]